MKWCLAVGVVAFGGCIGSSNRVVAPKIDPDKAASAAVVQYDADGDGALSKSECKDSAFDFDKWDVNSDGSLAETEIAERLHLYMNHGTGLLDLTCLVLLNRWPLEGGNVVFDPEPFLGDAIEAAEGTVNADGNVMPAIPELVAEDPVLTGVRPGLYKVKITHPDVDIPAKYNSETTLGFDASPIERLDKPVYRLQN